MAALFGLVTLLILAGVILVPIVFLWEKARNERRYEEASAYDPEPNWNGGFATEEELEAAGCFENNSNIVLGLSIPSGREINYNPEAGNYLPMLQIGGMNSKKTTGVHIPFSLMWEWSLILFEATCETALTTAHYRRRYGPVYIINPGGAFRKEFRGLEEVSVNSYGSYWLDLKRDNFGIRNRQNTEYAIPAASHARDPYWDSKSRDLGELVSRVLFQLGEDVNIGRIAHVFRGDVWKFLREAADGLDGDELGVLREEIETLLAADQVRSIPEVIQNINAHLAPFREPSVAASFSRPDIAPGMARQKPMTIIFVNPLESMGAMMGPRRFFMNCCFSELQSEQFAGDIPVAMLIDEMGAYPDENLRTSWSTLRKFDVFPVGAINDISTLEHLHGRHGAAAFINNAGVVQYMSVKDKLGCDALSASLGEYEVRTENMSIGTQVGKNMPSVNRSYSMHRRRIMEPWEIAQNMGPMDQIITMRNVAKPIYCLKRPYYNTDLVKKARPNPYAPKQQ